MTLVSILIGGSSYEKVGCHLLPLRRLDAHVFISIQCVEVDWSGIKLSSLPFHSNTCGLEWIHMHANKALVISLLRKLSSYYTMMIVGSSKWKRPPTIGMHWSTSQRILFWRSSATSPPAPCSPTNVSIAPRSTSSLTIIRCCPRLWLASSTTVRMAIETSPASLVYVCLLWILALQPWQCSCLKLLQ